MHSAHYAKTTIKRRTHLGSSPHSSLTAAKKKEKKSNKNFPKPTGLHMGTVDYTFPQGADEPHRRHHTVEAPEPQPFLKSLQYSVKETLFPDDPFRQFKNQNASRKVVLGLQYFFPICEWAPRYNLKLFKSDLLAGITIASLAIPQGISYAKLANLPPILGLCKRYTFFFFFCSENGYLY